MCSGLHPPGGTDCSRQLKQLFAPARIRIGHCMGCWAASPCQHASPWCAAGTLPLRVSPSKTPVRADSRRALPEGRGALAAGPAHPGAAGPATIHNTLPPALLMAVAGLHVYPQQYQG